MVAVYWATEREIGGVLDLIDQFDRQRSPRPEVSRQQQILEQLRSNGGGVVVAVLNDRVIATCTLNICANLSWGGRCFAIIENVIVDELHRRQGYGQAVLQKAVEQARARDCYKVALMTGSQRKGTHEFYERVGFKPDKTGFQIRFDA